MKRVLLVVLSLFLLSAVTAFGAETNVAAAKGSGTARQIHARQVDNPQGEPSAMEFPTVSKHQMPGIVPNVGCGGGEGGDPCQNDWDTGGGWTQGGCNCSRTCDGVCKPIGNNQCQAPTFGGGCSDCTNYTCP